MINHIFLERYDESESDEERIELLSRELTRLQGLEETQLSPELQAILESTATSASLPDASWD